MTTNARLPSYEPMLAAYHRAFAAELRGMLRSLPIAKGQTVLDMACGDGVYSGWLAECVGEDGRVVAVDSNPAYLDVAREANSSFAVTVEFVCAPIESLPFEDGRFDLCWIAHSLYSLPDPVGALRHLLRVTKPGGTVAVVENDTLHHVILPWPVEVELPVRLAELRALSEASGKPHRFYVGRHLRSVLREAGFSDITVRTHAHDRGAPLGPDERLYLTEHLKELTKRFAGDLDAPTRRRFQSLADPDSDAFLLDDPDLTATCIDQLACGRKDTQR